MRGILLRLLLCTAALAGCSPTPPPPATFAAVVEFKQLMGWVIDPAADVIWDSVQSIMTISGTKEIAPQTDEQWAAVRNAAATLAESSNLLMMEGRARDNAGWMSAARRLRVTATQAIKAAEAKDAAAVFAAGGEIYSACKACHEKYANFDQQAAPPAKAAK
jgi:hypothetical protein